MQNNKQNKLDNYLAVEEAKTKAGYQYNENSLEPTLQGAWRGSLLMGIPKTLHESHKNGRLNLKSSLAYYGAGALLGGATGSILNKQKAKEAKEARLFLAKNRLNNENKLLNKISRFNSDGIDSGLDKATDSTEDTQHNIKKDIAQGGAMGGVVGALLNMGSKRRMLKGAVTGTVISGAGSGVSDEVENKIKQDDKTKHISAPALMGASMGISTAIEPIFYRGIGRALGNKRVRYVLDDEYKDASNADQAYKKRSALEKIKANAIPNVMNKAKGGYETDNVDMIRGSKGKMLDKQLLHHTIGKALWGGAIGYGIGKVIDKLQHNNNNT